MRFRDTTAPATAPAATAPAATAPAATAPMGTAATAPKKKSVVGDRIQGKKAYETDASDAKKAALEIPTGALGRASRVAKPTNPTSAKARAPADVSYPTELVEAIVEIAEQLLNAGFGFAMTDEGKRAGIIGSHTGHVFFQSNRDEDDNADKDWLRIKQGDPTDDEVSERVEAFYRACPHIIDAAVVDITDTEEFEMPDYQPFKRPLRVYALSTPFQVVHTTKDQELAVTKYSGIVIKLSEDYLGGYLVVAAPTSV